MKHFHQTIFKDAPQKLKDDRKGPCNKWTALLRAKMRLLRRGGFLLTIGLVKTDFCVLKLTGILGSCKSVRLKVISNCKAEISCTFSNCQKISANLDPMDLKTPIIADPAPMNKSRLGIHTSPSLSNPGAVFSPSLILSIPRKKTVALDDVRLNAWLDGMTASSPPAKKLAY